MAFSNLNNTRADNENAFNLSVDLALNYFSPSVKLQLNCEFCRRCQKSSDLHLKIVHNMSAYKNEEIGPTPIAARHTRQLMHMLRDADEIKDAE